MKDYHPIGVARDVTGRYTHFLLKDERECKPHKPSQVEATIVSSELFDRLVGENRVQLFVKRADGQLEHAYTEEESRAYKKGIKAIGHLTLDDYFNSEAVFDAADLHNINAINFSLVLARPFSMGGLIAVTGAVYMRNMPATVQATLKRNALSMKMDTLDYAVCNWELFTLRKLLYTLATTLTVSCNVDTMSNPRNQLNQVKSVGFGTPSLETISAVTTALEGYVTPPISTANSSDSGEGGVSAVSRMSLQ